MREPFYGALGDIHTSTTRAEAISSHATHPALLARVMKEYTLELALCDRYADHFNTQGLAIAECRTSCIPAFTKMHPGVPMKFVNSRSTLGETQSPIRARHTCRPDRDATVIQHQP